MYHKSKLETQVNQRKRLFHSYLQTTLQFAYDFMFIHMIQSNVTQHIHTYTSKNTWTYEITSTTYTAYDL